MDTGALALRNLKRTGPRGFQVQWHVLSATDKYKMYTKGCRAKESWALQAQYPPRTFLLLSLQCLLPGATVQEVKKNRRTARARKFAKENLLWIHKPQHFLIHILSGLGSSKAENLFPALLLASGLRVSDIYFGAKCDPDPNHPYRMKVESHLKKGCRLSTDPKKGTISLLCQYPLFEVGLQRFRSLWPNVKCAKQASTCRAAVNKKWCLNAVGGYVENFKKCHSFRAIYAKFAYILWGRAEREACFFQRMLLHDSDYVSSEYETVKIPEDQWDSIRAFTNTEHLSRF